MFTFEEIVAKLITMEEATALLTTSFRNAHRVVFTNGCFDLLHRGHIYYLARAREMGDVLILGLNSDRSVTRLKGSGRPVNNQQARAEVLGALSMVDYIVVFEEDTPLDLILEIKPHILVKGGDYKVENIVGYHEVTAYGGKVVTIPLLEGYSTSSILDSSI